MFENCKTVQDVKNEYRRLIFAVHPDLHPAGEFAKWNEETRLLNEAYHNALEGRHGEVTYDDRNVEHTYHYNSSWEQAVVNKIDELIRAHLSPHIEVWIIGTWVWVDNTRREDVEDRAKLKAAGCVWHSKRLKWYWRDGGNRSHYNRRLSFDDLKSVYGASRVDHDEGNALNA